LRSSRFIGAPLALGVAVGVAVGVAIGAAIGAAVGLALGLALGVVECQSTGGRPARHPIVSCP